MKTLYLSFTDFWEGHDPSNNILTNIIKDVFSCDVEIVEESDADICFVTIYGNKFQSVLSKYSYKSILWLGENQRPNKFQARFSISFDFHSYSGKNIRMPLWLSEIDWYSTGLGVLSLNDVYPKLVKPVIDIDHSHMMDRDFCIAIFNNLEGTRLELFSQLQNISTVTGFGRPFGNWFPTYETYGAKLEKMSGYIFNMCPENSLYPGYYTEKCFHAKAAGCIPLYFADQWCKEDFNINSFINIASFRCIEESVSYIKQVYSDEDLMYRYLSQPLFNTMPSIDKYKQFIYYAVSKILSEGCN